ncbi:uncharacterized protein LDX57_010803 [Aspergillus melleus]|uniref:uncharacterized protein n=1 Tax=Aspergillus melleus TaxID=138277 RepID=UPI001E8EE683|nr:uncharacterized protein LDX57_010803 [Aspergillus melleus]KAH8433169.1 hypothetical protein LDX57_010803 [Aspergillus melleus]
MKITQPDGSGTVDVSQKWEIRWEDVVESEPKYADFWITHSHSPPYRAPVQLTDAINIHENDHVQIDGRTIENMPTGGSYRIWAMVPGQSPIVDPEPIAESSDIDIKNESNQ